MSNLDKHVSELERLSKSQLRWQLDRMIAAAFKTMGGNIYALDYNAKLFTELRLRGLWPPA